jgi:hypothetical protein
VTITLDARQFSTVTHAGTVSDPWPGSAILSALMALPATGGTVMVADGVWKIDSLLQLNGVNNFNLVGQSLNAQLMFTGAGQMWFGSAQGGIGGVSNATISTLTINANTLTMASPESAMRFSNAQNVSFNNNQILGDQNGSIPAVFFEGGSNNQILNNTITAGAGGGAALQLQPLGGTPNSGFVVSQNTFDSSGLQLIGLNNTKVTNNYFSNRTLGNFIGINICGPFAGTSQNITIDGNTLDASIVPGHENGAVISGIPNDPGGTSNIDGLSITNNILKGTVSLIAVQSLDPSNFTDNSLIGSNKTNVTITGNQLSSLWAGSTIDIRGGAGSVDKVLVQSNTLQNSAGAQNVITEDAHTTNATILLNQGANVYEVNDGGSALISSGVANSNTDPTVTLTGTAPAGSTATVSDGGSTHPTPPNAPDVTLPQAAIDTGGTGQEPTFTVNGSAINTATHVYTVTPNTQGQAGSVVSDVRVDLTKTFDITFDINVGNNDNGADGMAFVLHNDPLGDQALGGSGGNLGMFGIKNGVGIEFDTYDNTEAPNDIANGHTNFDNTGALYNANNAALSPVMDLGNIEDGQWHQVHVVSDGQTAISYTFDGVQMSSLSLASAESYLGSQYAYFGFTGGTGGLGEQEQVRLDALTATTENGTPLQIGGAGGEVSLDLADIAFGSNTTLGYAANSNNTGGTLTVSDGTHTANIALLGQYMAASFAMSADGFGGTLIHDNPPATLTQTLTQPQHG